MGGFEGLEIFILVSSVILVSAASSLLVMSALLDSLVISGPLVAGEAKIAVVEGDLESLVRRWGEEYSKLITEVNLVFWDKLIGGSWTLLMASALAASIGQYPLVSRIRRQLPSLIYRLDSTPGRIFMLVSLISLLYSALIATAFISAVIIVSLWSLLELWRPLVTPQAVSLTTSLLLLGPLFSSIYLSTGRIDLSTLSTLALSIVMYLSYTEIPGLMAALACILEALAVIAWCWAISITRRWAW
jgi:hypothetical protein